ncbi:aTP-binding and permease protein of ABC transporter [Bifidobacterium pseudolongum subsp. pseudolongum]|uniref:ABC transporter transmembrane domain-containing protein n=1 Tax=Bifidobacterium pseudolongum TaxID=1694 RepID=UPI000CC14054|nr:ABC transporter transmembrane domain-containing protein [Bifidobacterium pseudolongum]PKV07808.1 aTP-binding and permease protein of ABC transporter [Bifidobacterium pseudolongum subsp. pseudolongum]
MKPLTVALMAADVVGALLVPTLAARRLNEGTAAMSFHTMTMTALQMLAVSLVSGCCAIGAGYCCSVLAARVAKDMRDAIYVKSLDLSVFDFRRFGTASMVTRTMSDVVNIQVAITNVIMMLLPVPFIFVVSLTFAFGMDTTLAWWLVGAMVCVCVIAVFILRSASPLYRRLQRLLDRIGAVLFENLTGVRRRMRLRQGGVRGNPYEQGIQRVCHHIHQDEPPVREPRRSVVPVHHAVHRGRCSPLRAASRSAPSGSSSWL